MCTPASWRFRSWSGFDSPARQDGQPELPSACGLRSAIRAARREALARRAAASLDGTPVTDSDRSSDLQELVRQAMAERAPLCVHGGRSKEFYGRACSGQALDVSGHRGILSYEPTELVITARAGTPLAEIEQALGEQGQMLPFEPPHFAPGATLGGAVASGLAGPRRPWGGAPRDLLLGIKVLDGQGRILRFGGQVMKNVAGYDVSRLMAGALGTLGILLELSLKVLPRAPREATLLFEMGMQDGLQLTRTLAGRPLPITGAAQHGDHLYLRLAGSEEVLAGHRAAIGWEFNARSDHFWTQLRDHRLAFFDDPRPLWRLSLPPAAPHPIVDGPTIIDWAGAQRWCKTDVPAEELRAKVSVMGGHAALFRHGDRSGEVFQPLAPPLARLQQALKRVFDPPGIINPGRLYVDW